jgi:hypothetical protein
VLMMMLICYERKILLNGWLILADKFKRTGCFKFHYSCNYMSHTYLYLRDTMMRRKLNCACCVAYKDYPRYLNIYVEMSPAG